MRYLIFSMVLMLICGCGEAEKTPCDELKDIWKEICAIPDGPVLGYSHTNWYA
jgi:hypothetical protein